MSWLGKAGLNTGITKSERKENMKISKRKFLIKETGTGFNIFLRNAPDHPLDRNEFPDKNAAEKRLNEYIRKANATA